MYMDSVRRGDMVRDVRGPGSLVPEHITWISAQANARVDKLVAESGQSVKTGDMLLETSNPDQQIQALNAEQALSAAQAELVTPERRHSRPRLSRRKGSSPRPTRSTCRPRRTPWQPTRCSRRS